MRRKSWRQLPDRLTLPSSTCERLWFEGRRREGKERKRREGKMGIDAEKRKREDDKQRARVAKGREGGGGGRKEIVLTSVIKTKAAYRYHDLS